MIEMLSICTCILFYINPAFFSNFIPLRRTSFAQWSSVRACKAGRLGVGTTSVGTALLTLRWMGRTRSAEPQHDSWVKKLAE